MGRYNDDITVTLVHDPIWGLRPGSFTWRKSKKTVRAVQDSWREQGRWWLLEPPQTVWRVWTTDGGLFELAHVHSDPPKWKLLYSHD